MQFRLERTGPIMVLAGYLLVLVLAFFLTYMIGTYYENSWQESLSNYWHLLLAIQIFALVVAGSLRVAGSVVREKEQKRFDFQIVTGMSPWRIAEGEMVGSTLFHYFLILCALPFSVLCVLGGGVSWELFGFSYLILFAGAFFFHSWALLSSSVARTYAGAITATLVVVALFSAAALLVGHDSAILRTFSAVSPFSLPYSRLAGAGGPGNVAFFNAEFPEFFAVAVLYVFLGVWVLNGAVRKIRSAPAPYITKLQGVVFSAVFLTVVSGLLAPRVPGAGETLVSLFYQNTAIYLTVSLLLLIVFAFMLSPSAESYAMLMRRRIKGVWYTIFGGRSLFLVNLLVLFAIAVAIYFAIFAQTAGCDVSLTETVGGRKPLERIFVGFAFVLFAALFYSIVVQLCVLLSRRAGREIAAAILLVLVLLPGLSEIWSEAPQTGFLQVFDPMAVLLSVLPAGTAEADMNLSLAAVLFYFVFCALLGALLFARLRSAHSRLAPPVTAAKPSPSES